jgi:hypothetical protein
MEFAQMLAAILIGLLIIVLGCALVQYLPFIPANLKQLLMVIVVILGILYMVTGTGVLSGTKLGFNTPTSQTVLVASTT